jgi:predicted methyltransferase
MNETALTLCLALAAVACVAAPPPAAAPPSRPSGDVSLRALAIVDAPDRTYEDRVLDGGRHAAELLDFLGIEPGMRVAELVAGAGYTADLLARSVAPTGVLYAENPRVVLEGADKPWSDRLARPAMKTVVRVDRELDPLPPEAKDLDLVVINLVYHDTVYLGVDRGKMNQAVFAALKRGGRYAVIDHSVRPGRGVADVKTLHRIDEKIVIDEVERAGFRLQTKDSFLRNPSDARDWNASPEAAAARRGQSDRFAIMFVKP